MGTSWISDDLCESRLNFGWSKVASQLTESVDMLLLMLSTRVNSTPDINFRVNVT